MTNLLQIPYVYKATVQAVILGSVLFSCAPAAQQAPNPIQLLQQSLDASGDLSDPELQLSVQIVASQAINRGQSLHPAPPYGEEYSVESQFLINRPENSEIALHINPFNGFLFQAASIVNDEQSTTYVYYSKTAFEADNSGFDNFRHFPQPYLVSALADSALLSYEGLQQLENGHFHVIKVNTPRTTTLFLDSKSLLLKKLERQVLHQPYGDGLLIKKFTDYQRFNGLMLPQKIKSGAAYDSWGTLFNNYEVSPLETPIQLFDTTSYRPLEPNFPAASWVQLADNIYMVRNVNDDNLGISDYNVLVAEFEDFILVGEAPVSNQASIKALDMIEAHFPNKPVRYMVQSHHHSDHIGGIRQYIAHGVTLVAATPLISWFDRIADAKWTLAPDSLALAPLPVKSLAVDSTWQLSDNLNSVQVFDIGPIPHVNNMLVLYFPKQQLLWQTDMISYQEWPLDSEPSQILLDRIRQYQWSIKTIAGVHGAVLTEPQLTDYLQD